VYRVLVLRLIFILLLFIPSLYPGSAKGTGFFSSEYSSEEQELLDRIIFDRQRIKKRSKKSPVIESEILWRPRGATMDGRYVIFERRLYAGKRIDFALVVFDLKRNTEEIYRLPGFKQRNTLLQELLKKYDIFEGIVVSANLNLSGKYISKWDTVFEFPVYQDEQQVYHVKAIAQKNGIKRIIFDYSFPMLLEHPPTLENVYMFKDQRGVGIKISTKKYTSENKIQYKEIVLCFLEDNIGPERTIIRENAFELTEKQKNIVYLEKIEYDYNKEIIEKTLYYLDGKITYSK
jgi:hypothetical protein